MIRRRDRKPVNVFELELPVSITRVWAPGELEAFARDVCRRFTSTEVWSFITRLTYGADRAEGIYPPGPGLATVGGLS